MTTALGTAIFNRWNAAGLDDTDLPATNLYPGGDESQPEGVDLPRAEYEILDDLEELKSRSSRIRNANVRFTVWDDSYEDCGTALQNIEDAFVNSESASSNPITMSGGTILGVEHVSTSGPTKQDTSIYQGIVDLMIRWRKANEIP